MNGLKNNDFFLGNDFLTHLCNWFKYLYYHKQTHLTVNEYLDGLRNHFEFDSVAVIRYYQTGKDEIEVSNCFPISDREFLESVCQDQPFKEIVFSLISDVANSDTSKYYHYPSQGGGKRGSGIIDLILLPNIRKAITNPEFCDYLLLIDALYLSDFSSPALHIAQRTFLTQFVRDWWATCTNAVVLVHSSEVDKITLPISEALPQIWLQDMNLEDVMRAQLRSLTAFKNHGKTSSNQTTFRFGDIDWEKWAPIFHPFATSDEDTKESLENIKTIYYWWKWMGSHHKLEQDRHQKINYSEYHDQIEIAEWVSQQRKSPEQIYSHVDDLRKHVGWGFVKGERRFVSRSNFETDQIGVRLKDKKSLLSFSFNQWLHEHGSIRNRLGSASVSDIEFCRCLHGLAVTAHYLLTDVELSDDLIHRLTQLLAFYGHGELRIPDRLDLRAHLLQAARGESALHVLKPYYRDHFFHTLEVCFLGHVFLASKLSDGRFLWQLVSEALSLKTARKEDILKLWYMAALLHDIGYAIDVLDRSREYLSFFQHSKALRKLGGAIKQEFEKFASASEMRNLGVELEKGEEIDHGVVGALHLHSLLSRIAQDTDDVNVAEYQPVIQAIALHNLHNRHNPILFAEKPLAFLLALCDQLQEWRRPRLPYATAPGWMLSRLSGGFSPGDEIDNICKSMTINLNASMNDENDILLKFPREKKKDPCMNVRLEYSGKINRNSSIFYVWLDATLNFQRLNLKGLPLNITVTYINPLQDAEGNVYPPQFYRLRDAAHETHMTFLTDWFPGKTDPDNLTNSMGANKPKISLSNGAVSYALYEEKHGIQNEREELTLNLRELSRKPLMTKDMRAFQKCLEQWKHYNEDREFPGDYVAVKPE